MHRLIIICLLLTSCRALRTQNVVLPDPAPFTTVSMKMVMQDHELTNDFPRSLQKSYGIEFSARRQYTKRLGLLIPLRLGNMDVGEFQNRQFGSMDLLARFNPVGSEKAINPYLQAGYGFTFEQEAETFRSVPVGLGFDFKIGDDMWIGLQAEYRSASREQRDNVNASLGYVYRFGRPDRDGDRIPDGQDKCPDVPGQNTANGCPDADRDGVPDEDDRCPDTQGSKTANGCPDYDKDGVPDDRDQCPYEAGKKRLRGCPDIDNDGVPDDIDDCPNTPGNLYTGCPDTDGDGFDDKDDDCPDIAGPNRGCPEVSPELRSLLDRATNRVTFEGRSSTLTPQSLPLLDEIAVNLRANPSFKLTIGGHTDNIGTPENNERLSQTRALACRGYLVSKGIDGTRIKVIAYGATRPRADNATVVGRELNNRMAFTVAPR